MPSRHDVKFCSRACQMSHWKANNLERARELDRLFKERHRETVLAQKRQFKRRAAASVHMQAALMALREIAKLVATTEEDQ